MKLTIYGFRTGADEKGAWDAAGPLPAPTRPSPPTGLRDEILARLGLDARGDRRASSEWTAAGRRALEVAEVSQGWGGGRFADRTDPDQHLDMGSGHFVERAQSVYGAGNERRYGRLLWMHDRIGAGDVLLLPNLPEHGFATFRLGLGRAVSRYPIWFAAELDTSDASPLARYLDQAFALGAGLEPLQLDERVTSTTALGGVQWDLAERLGPRLFELVRETLRACEPRAFERLLREQLERVGYRFERQNTADRAGGDFDLVVHWSGGFLNPADEYVAIQAKCYRGEADLSDAVEQLRRRLGTWDWGAAPIARVAVVSTAESASTQVPERLEVAGRTIPLQVLLLDDLVPWLAEPLLERLRS